MDSESLGVECPSHSDIWDKGCRVWLLAETRRRGFPSLMRPEVFVEGPADHRAETPRRQAIEAETVVAPEALEDVGIEISSLLKDPPDVAEKFCGLQDTPQQGRTPCWRARVPDLSRFPWKKRPAPSSRRPPLPPTGRVVRAPSFGQPQPPPVVEARQPPHRTQELDPAPGDAARQVSAGPDHHDPRSRPRPAARSRCRGSPG